MAVRRDDPPLSLDEVKESITAKGRERGFVTSEDLLEAVPVDDFTPEQVEEFLTQVGDHLTTEGIEVIEVPGEETDAATQVRIEVDLLKAPTNDPVRMYLKEIGKVPLLNAAQEIDLARRIEAGELSTALQLHVREDVEEKVDPHAMKVCVRKVWEIRDHQMTAFGRYLVVPDLPDLAHAHLHRVGIDLLLDLLAHMQLQRGGQLSTSFCQVDLLRGVQQGDLADLLQIHANRVVGRRLQQVNLPNANLGVAASVSSAGTSSVASMPCRW